ncbi:LLM class flavin-dependent oxidoreductase [Nocardia arthritidis]|uniref:MsnO8 family LLM class oxidoreductase n=1 Tax=Nocardia arthritidis TaxID=228602 RepID=A0A6G9YDJ6_9NOCA|nr:LLM class flavin-dependent oxidoreductase [Nocardia arthritidis]QIS11147.1 MsnO8 family LLM class oxidoreductase [Nocardia arthritidis]
MRISVLDHSPVASGATAADALANTVALARHADRLGYHRFWLAEHHGLPSHAGPAPEIMIGRVAAETSGIRIGSGGILLTLYSPLKVAEVFRTLHALYPGRIDLGIGRSTGALPLEVRALGRDPDRPPTEAEFQSQLSELLGFLSDSLPADHPYEPIVVMPATPDAPPVWLLGSSPASAIMAARNGLPYSYAHFINPAATETALDAYRREFASAASGTTPRVLLGVGIYCAETESEAHRLYASHRALRGRMVRSRFAPVPDPDTALAELASAPDLLADDESPWPRCLVGTPDQIRALIIKMTAELSVDELIVMSIVHDHAARVRSYELLAEAMELTPRA